MKYDFDGISPKIGEIVFIAESSAIIGDVTVGENSSIWFGAVLRGDEGKITVGERSNIQDNATVHSKTKIGNGVTIGHNAIVHGCEIGNNVLIGMGATVLDDAVIGDDSIVGAGTLVTGKKVFPPRSLIIGSPAVLKRELSEEEIESIRHNAKEYVDVSKKYMK